MQFPKSLHAEGWHAHMPVQQSLPGMDTSGDEAWPPHARRRFHALIIVVAVAALAASAGLDVVDDPRPLDVQASSAMNKAGNTLKDWQGQLSRGLQVSLRAVADGQETLKPGASASAPKAGGANNTVVAQVEPEATPAVDARDQAQPVRADLAPRQQPQQQPSAVDR